MNKRVRWPVVGMWTALTALGVLLAGGMHFPGDFGTRYWGLVEVNWASGLVGFVFGAVSGVFIAGLPALMLPGLGVPARRWLAFNLLAFGLIHAMADAIPYRPLVIVGGGPLLALCQYLALRNALSRPYWWVPAVTVAWWLGFGLTAGTTGYDLLVIGPLLGAVTGLLLRLLLVPAPAPRNSWWSRLSRPAQVVLAAGLLIGLGGCTVVYAGLSGLTGLFQ